MLKGKRQKNGFPHISEHDNVKHRWSLTRSPSVHVEGLS